MGLIKAGLGALGGTLADQWKEFFYCDAINKDILYVKGQKRTSDRSSNTKGSDNIISNGSGIAVADGQCMIIVEQGKIVEVCAEPGEYTYDKSTEPSIFSGKLGDSIKETFKTLGKRFTYGGDTGKDQRVYYFNLKEIIDNKFGTPTPIMFRIVDRRVFLDMDAQIRVSGIYSYKIADPILFYTNVGGNVSDEFPRSEIDNQLKTEFISALQPAFAEISKKEVRPSELPAYAEEISDAMNTALTKKWGETRGLKVVSVALNPVSLTEEYEKKLANAQNAAIYANAGMGAGNLNAAAADATRDAANNPNGAMMGFMGMSMAQQQNAGTMQTLYGMNAQQQAQQAPAAPAQPAPANGWVCKCGAKATGKFCPECGSPKPAEEGWTCKCGAINKGKFCSECGAKKPEGAPLYRCDKCGWEPEDPAHPPKFCPECGDVFDDKDIK